MIANEVKNRAPLDTAPARPTEADSMDIPALPRLLDLDPSLVLTAVHEAGHAVASHPLEVAFRYVTAENIIMVFLASRLTTMQALGKQRPRGRLGAYEAVARES